MASRISSDVGRPELLEARRNSSYTGSLTLTVMVFIHVS
jgi:hypothetical protein